MASETIYDHPLYYDILFGWDRRFECDFYDYSFKRYGVGRDEPVLEVACGTGRVALLLAHLGWRVTGFDINPAMLAFLEERRMAEGLELETVCGDMVSSTLGISFGAAFNPLSSFRLLHTDAQVEAHLHAMAANLRAGGIYVLDLELQADEGGPSVTAAEDWEMSRSGVTVTATDEAIHVDDRGLHLVLAWGGDSHLRGYTPTAFVESVNAAGCFRIEAWHPESTRETGLTEFALQPTDAPGSGRGMAVLRRL